MTSSKSLRRIVAVFLAFAYSVAASAEWFEARTARFVVIADDKENRVTKMASQLEQFAAAMRTIYATAIDEGADANPVTIYVLPSIGAIQQLYGGGGVGGFYIGRASGSVAFTPNAADFSGQLKPQIVLFHEYAHHFLLGNYAQAYPAWFSEGFAEFVSTARFSDTAITFGYAAQHRGYGLVSDDGLGLSAVFDPPKRTLTGEELESIYARGWLLTHYLMFDPARQKQLSAYLRAVNRGASWAKAARDAFGDMRDLNRSLERYMRGSRLPGMSIALASLPTPKVTLRRLSAGEAAMVQMRMVSDRGVDKKGAAALLARGQKVAARFPDDPVVQGGLSEMAFDADDLGLAETAADRALVRDPRSAQALEYKARVHMTRAATAGAAVAWDEARGWIVKANRLSPDSAESLILFYQSFREQGIAPSKSAIAGLNRAFELVPQDEGLRYTVVREALAENDLVRARSILRPLAYSPHNTAESPASRLLASLDGGRPGPQLLVEFDQAAKAAATKDPNGDGKDGAK